ncbi:Zinc finger domain-containing protein [Spironucleus salmonicida]|uniref:Zinc finger domain-containing protein n=1 Tax=Spironucleus salmonicida TaxID=348837 RepID=V6LK65_9EUKA|nr:Zinc finger domain-containing protein [Spironucleus salmonicida]|eukprot:EST45015.1 Zinc finger domain-containing protein [Spironucleus salmonicida]
MATTRGKNHSRSKTKYNRKHDTAKLMPDQVLERLTPEQLEAIENKAPDPFLPGEGKNYCIFCDQHFISDHNLQQHMKGSGHKLRMKCVRDGGFTPNDAMKAACVSKDLGLKKK